MFDPGHLYNTEKKAVKIFESLEAAILRGELNSGDKLPAVREVAQRWGVNKNTVAAAYRMLQDGGLIVAAGRNGSLVASRTSLEPVGNRETPSPAANAIALHDGNPARLLLPSEDIFRAHLSRIDLAELRYSERRNYEPLLEQMGETFKQDGIPFDKAFVSAGALDAISWALRNNLKVGDKVGVEDPGYATIVALVRSLGMRLVGIPIDRFGLLPEGLSAAYKRGVKAVVLSSRAQNPTGACTSEERAQILNAIIENGPDVLYIDDDHSSLLKLSPYRLFVPQAGKRWMVVRSLSKFLGPDLRISVCAGDDATLGRLEIAQALSMGWVSRLLQRLASALLDDPLVRQGIEHAGKVYKSRYAELSKALLANGFDVAGHTGLNLWVPLDEEVAVVAEMARKGWLLRSGSDFVLQSRPGIRVTSAGLPEDQVTSLVTDLVAARDSVRG